LKRNIGANFLYYLIGFVLLRLEKTLILHLCRCQGKKPSRSRLFFLY
jgi:hypothetical protein